METGSVQKYAMNYRMQMLTGSAKTILRLADHPNQRISPPYFLILRWNPIPFRWVAPKTKVVLSPERIPQDSCLGRAVGETFLGKMDTGE